MKLIPIPVNKENFYRRVLEVVKAMPPINKLRPKELAVLAELMRLNDELRHLDTVHRYMIINSTETRKKIRTKLDMPEASFNNNISILRKYKILTKSNKLNPFFEDIEYSEGFRLGFLFKEK